MKNAAYTAASIAALAVSGGADAALLNGSTLTIGAGSYFVMEVAPGYYLPTSISNNAGLIIGTAQSASGSHSGPPNGSESPGIDIPWEFYGNTGMHFTATPVNILSAGGNTATLDFSGWRMTWNDIPSMDLGSGAWNNAGAGWSGNVDGVAQIVCVVDCSYGDTYELQYTARVPYGATFGGGLAYGIKLTGTISAVPVPAAVWLLGSGLAGLAGIAGRRRTAGRGR